MKVIISAPARADISSIYKYLRAEANDGVARTIVADIRERCLGLERMPERYQMLPGYETQGYRRRIYRDYLIVYAIAKDRVNIIRIVHGASDYQKLLAETK